MINVDFLALLHDKLSISGYDLRLEKFSFQGPGQHLREKLKLLKICYKSQQITSGFNSHEMIV